jgi:hypothetical protein
VRRFAALAALAVALLLAGCGGPAQQQEEAATPPPPPKQKPAALSKVEVTVVDGNTHERVRRARVTIGKHSRFTDARGVALVPVKVRRGRLTEVRAPGYLARSVLLPFDRRPQSTVHAGA